MTGHLSVSVLQKILSNVEEAVLLVCQDGRIIKGNNSAESLLGYEELRDENIKNYLDFDRLKIKEKVNTLMELKNKAGQFIEVKSIRMNANTYCLVVQHVSLEEETTLAMHSIKDDYQHHDHLFVKTISSQFHRMFKMENDLREALKKNQFQLHYQPQKSFSSNNVVGVEALLRWNHPVKGNIPPMDFISLAEKTGLIIPIGDWVLEEACKQNKKWQEQGYHPIVISVNMSAKQFHQHNLVEKVKSTLYSTGLDPIYLELEITESMALPNEKYLLKTMQSLQELGVVVSIDDFGTGYSSLKYLSLFPVNKLKIDKMFMDTNQIQNQAIVKSIINMSHSLNMEVIAEGVETIDQVLFLQREKCDQMQGYYFSKPVEAKKFVQFLQRIS